MQFTREEAIEHAVGIVQETLQNQMDSPSPQGEKHVLWLWKFAIGNPVEAIHEALLRAAELEGFAADGCDEGSDELSDAEAKIEYFEAYAKWWDETFIS